MRNLKDVVADLLTYYDSGATAQIAGFELAAAIGFLPSDRCAQAIEALKAEEWDAPVIAELADVAALYQASSYYTA